MIKDKYIWQANIPDLVFNSKINLDSFLYMHLFGELIYLESIWVEIAMYDYSER